jgi:hypothetical protein
MRYDAMQVFQSLIEIQKDLSGLSSDTRRAIADIAKLDGKVSHLSEVLAWAKGFAVAAVILIPVCAGFIWWLAGDKLNHIRDELIGVARQSQSTQPVQPAPPAAVTPSQR